MSVVVVAFFVPVKSVVEGPSRRPGGVAIIVIVAGGLPVGFV
jgi:hypothetical protein